MFQLKIKMIFLLSFIFCVLSSTISFASVSQTKYPGLVYAQSSANPLRVPNTADGITWDYVTPNSISNYDENDYEEFYGWGAALGAPTSAVITFRWAYSGVSAPSGYKFEVWDDSAGVWVNEVGLTITNAQANYTRDISSYITTANDANNLKVRVLAYQTTGDVIYVRIDRFRINFNGGTFRVPYYANSTNVARLSVSDNIRFASYDVPAAAAYDETDYFEYQNFNFNMPTGSIIGGSGGQAGVIITYEVMDTDANFGAAKLEGCDAGDVACVWQNHSLLPKPNAADQTYTINTTYITTPAELNGSVYKLRILGWENSAGNRYLSADYLKVNAKRRIIASDVAVLAPSTATYYAAQTNRLMLDFIVPDDDGVGDTLNYIYIKNTGTAVNTTDILNLKLYEDGAVAGWSGDETQVGVLPFTWVPAQSRWELTGLTTAIPIGGKRLFISCDIASNPTDARTIKAQIPTSGIGVASGFGGPTDTTIDNSSTQTIDGMIATQITNTGAATLTNVNASSTNILIMDFTIPLNGVTADTLNGLRVQNLLGTAVNSTDISIVKAWAESGVTPGFQSAQDTNLGTLTWNGANSSWENTGLTLVYASAQRIYITADISSNPTDAATIKANLKTGGTDATAGVVVTSGNDGPLDAVVTNANTQTINGAIASQITNTNAPTATFYAGDTNKQVMNFIVPANGVTADTINTLRIKNSGSAINSTDISAVKFWADDGDGTFEPGTGDTNLGTATWSGVWWELTGLSQSTGTSGQRIFASVDIAASPTGNSTIQMYLPFDGAGTNAGIQVASGNDGPIDSNITNTNTQTIKLLLSVSGADAAGVNMELSSTNNKVLCLTMTASSSTITLNTLQVDRTGTSADSDVAGSGVKLWHDVDNNCTYNGGTDAQLSTSKTFAGGTVSFDTISFNVVSGTPEKLLVTYNIAGGAATGNTVGGRILNSTYIAATGADISLSPSPTTSTNSLIGKTVTVVGTDKAVGYVAAGQTNVVMEQLNFSASTGTMTISSVKVDRSGVGADADISAVYLYDDVDDSGTLNGPDIQLSTTQTYAGGTLTFGAVSKNVVNGTPENLLIVYDFAVGATTGDTVGAKLTNSTYITMSADAQGNNVYFSVAPISSTETIINPALYVSRTDKAPAEVEVGTQNVVMEQLTLNFYGGSTTVNTVKVDRTGTSADSDISAVKLYHDVNNNGTYEGGTDVQLSTTQTFSGGTLTFSGVAFTVTEPTAENLLIVYNISGTATPAVTAGVNLVDKTYITISSGGVFNFSNLQSTNSTIKQTLTITGTDKAAGLTDVTKSQTNIVFEQVTLSASSGTVTLSSLKVDKLGTAADADISAVKLYDDVNDNGTYEPATDTQLSTTQTFAGGTLTFGAINKNIVNGTTENLLVMIDIAAGATVLNTIGVSIVNTIYITASQAGVTKSMPTQPISSSTKSIKNAASLTASFTTPSGPLTVNTNESFSVVLRISNATNSSAANSVAPTSGVAANVCANYTVVSGTPTTSLVSGPSPTSATIAGGSSQDFTYSCQGDTAGVAYLSGGAQGTESNLGTTVTASSVNTPNITINPQVSPLWTFNDSGTAQGWNGEGIVRSLSDGCPYFFGGNDNGKFYAVAITTCGGYTQGTKRWSYNAVQAIKSQPEYYYIGGSYYFFFGDDGGDLNAVIAETGTAKASFPVNVSASAIRSGVTGWTNISGEDRVFFGDTAGTLHCRIVTNGNVCTGISWPVALNGAINTTPAINDTGAVYVATGSGWLYNVAWDSGTIGPNVSGYTSFTSSPIVFPDNPLTPTTDKIYLGSWLSGRFYRFTPLLAVDWNFSQSSPIATTQWKTTSWVKYWVTRYIWAGNANGSVYKFDDTGSLVWKYPSGASTLDPITTSVVVVGGKVFFGTSTASNGKVYKLTDNGATVSLDTGWPYSASGKIVTSPYVQGSRVIVGDSNGSLYAFPQ